MSGRLPGFIAIAIVLVATGTALFPSLGNNFVDWDDPLYVTENPSIQGLSAHNLKAIFTQSFVGCYCPLAVASYAFEYRFFGAAPFYYHLTNYLLHLVVTLLVLWFIYLISSSYVAAFVCALLFGVHPMHVESIAWISERKDVLCALFYLASLIAYVRYAENKRFAYYAAAFAAALLAFFSKPMAVTIPLVFFLLDYLSGRQFSKQVILEKVPFVALSAVFGGINFFFQWKGGATALVASTGVKAYFLSKAIPFYLYTFFLPSQLSAIYPYHDVGPADLSKITYHIGALVLIFLAVAVAARYSRKILFGALFFLVTILPVLKIVPAGDAFAADRYMYIPSIGILFMAAVGIEKIFSVNKVCRVLVVMAVTLVTVALSLASWERCKVWDDTVTLFSDVIKKYPVAPLPYSNIGVFFAERGEHKKAMRYFEMSLAVKPDFEMARYNLRLATKRAVAQERNPGTGKADELTDDIEHAQLMNRVGEEQGRTGHLDGAISLFGVAIKLAPGYAESYNNMGYVYYRKGDLEKARDYFKKAVAADPEHEKARLNLDSVQARIDAEKRR